MRRLGAWVLWDELRQAAGRQGGNSAMAYDIAGDVRLDPRIKALLAAVPTMAAKDVDSRETMVAEANTPAALKGAEEFRQVMEMCDTEELAPSKGLHIHTEQIVSQPDGNTINLQVIRPETEDTVACVYYIHGGGMMTLSCYDGMYRAWGKVIAANGVAVVMVDFRNAVGALVGSRGGALPGRPQRLRLGSPLGRGPRRRAQHRPGAHRGGRRERGRQPDPGHRAQAQAGRRSRAGQGALRTLSLHRRPLAATREPLVDGEQRDPARPAQQPGGHGLRDRAARGREPSGVAVVRHASTTSPAFLRR